jgi:hypothetical protein
MIVPGIVLLVIGFLTKITVVWAIGLITLAVGLLFFVSAQSATRWAPAASAGGDAPQRLREPGWARRRDRSRLRDHRRGPMVLRGPLGWNG